MPAKKGSAPRDQSWYDSLPGGDPDKKGKMDKKLPSFVRGELTDQEKEHVKAQKYTWDDIVENMALLVEDDYKITVARDHYNTSYATWITPQNESNPNYGFILSGRRPTVLASIAVAFYKHFTKFDSVWPKPDQPRERDPWG